MPQIPQNINECDVITIFPMDVECLVVHPSTLNSSDGIASLSITGGTPPYDIVWEDGSVGPIINNLSVGEYNATITDYYGDFTIQTTCVLTGETDCSFNISVEEFIFPTPTPTVTSTPTPTPGVTPTPTVTPTQTPGVTPTPTNTPTPSSSSPGFCFCGQMQSTPSCDSFYTVEYYKCGETSPTIETFLCDVIAVLCVDPSQPPPISIDGSAEWIPSTPIELCDNNTQCGGGGSQQRISFTPCYYTVTITGGTSEGPYTIYYDVIGPDNIAIKHPSGSLATNLTLSEMYNGVNVFVPCSANIILVFNELCDTTQTASVVPNIPINSFCITYSGGKQKLLVGNGYDSNGNPTWISSPTTECEVFWNTTINEWELTCLLNGEQAYSNDPISSNPPINGWYTIGTAAGELIVNQGACLPRQTLNFNVSVNQPDCNCDGSISIVTIGGTPPYQYSINNGLTYFNTPIFTNLCSGVYSIIVKDNDNNTTNQSINLNELTPQVNYNLSLTTTSNVTINTSTIYEVNYLTTLNITPPIPTGINITLDIIHLGIFENLGKINYSTLNRNLILKKNQIPIAITSTNINNYTSPAPPQCLLAADILSPISRQFSATTNNWSSITISKDDVISIETYSRVTKTSSPTQCQDANDTNTFSLSNASISGCDCCDVEIDTTCTPIATQPKVFYNALQTDNTDPNSRYIFSISEIGACKAYERYNELISLGDNPEFSGPTYNIVNLQVGNKVFETNSKVTFCSSSINLTGYFITDINSGQVTYIVNGIIQSITYCS